MLAFIPKASPGKQEDTEGWSWWKHGIIYQVLVKSFYDSDGDGIGDIQGIIHKLDYLADLGITALWLTPIFESTMYDQGYDVRDYLEIDPRYGTLEDFIVLLDKAHERDIRIILDMVLNHTSHYHPWFLESRSSVSNAKRDWYIWRDGEKGKPPNNWKSAFGGSAWEWDEKTQQYYLHSFLKEQPDLNWRNPELKKEFSDIFRKWLNLGVDGFRLDVINTIIKDKKFRDNPRVFRFPFFQDHRFNRDRPKSIKVVKWLRTLINEYPDRVIVGEVYTLPPGNSETVASYLGNGDNALHMAFDFSLIFSRWNARRYYKAIKKWYKHIPKKGWPCHVLSNHDLHRSINRYGILRDKNQKARVAAVMLLTLKGTPFLYYGEEIGMENIRLKRREIDDPLGKKFWPIYSGRDQARSPMQWNKEKHSGFTKGTPWLRVAYNYQKKNVQVQLKDNDSILNTYRKLIHIRQHHSALQYGKWTPVSKGYNGVLSYIREDHDMKIFVVLNFSPAKKTIHLPDKSSWKVLFSTNDNSADKIMIGKHNIIAYEAVILEMITDKWHIQGQTDLT
jgi:alpha-glucosidase